MSGRGTSVRDMIRGNDVTMMRSYLEVDVAEWFSENEIPFAYEAFTIPSVVGPGKEQWDDVVQAVRAVGEGDRDSVDMPDGSVMDAYDILSLWNDIYQKHRLAGERVVIDPKPALAGFDKRLMMPDFAIYNDFDGKNAGDDFEWGNFDYIVEVSGLYGVGLPNEAGESEWWDWYRLSAVGFKEFMYRMLGLWDRTVWVIPNTGGDGNGGQGIPPELRNDDHYIIMDTTQTGIQLQKLAEYIGVTAQPGGSGLSPEITPTKYKRPLTSTTEYERNQITPVPHEYEGLHAGMVDNNKNASLIEDGWVLFHGDMGEVYLDGESVRVRESQWRGTNMLMLREYVLSVLVELHDDGIVEELREA